MHVLAVHVLAETTTAKCSLKEILIKKGEEWKLIMRKTSNSRLLDFLLFLIKGNQQNI